MSYFSTRRKKYWERNLAGISCRDRNLVFFPTFCCCNNLFSELSQHLIPATFNVFEKKIIFSHFSKAAFCLLFPSTKVCLQLGNFPSCGNKLQYFYSVKGIFRRPFLLLQQLATLNFSEISIFKFL